MIAMKDISNICKHVKIHGTNQLESDTERLIQLRQNITDCLEEFVEVDQNFQWCGELNNPRKEIWLNLYGILLDLDKTIESYKSTLGIARASLIVPPQTWLDGAVPA